MAARLEAPRAGVRPVTVSAPARRAGVASPRLPAAAELAAIGAGVPFGACVVFGLVGRVGFGVGADGAQAGVECAESGQP